jgi:hypothetical protein
MTARIKQIVTIYHPVHPVLKILDRIARCTGLTG